MHDVGKLNHTTWDCKYHLICIPKYRKKLVYGQLRKHLGEVFRGLSTQKEGRVVEGISWQAMSIYCSRFRQNTL